MYAESEPDQYTAIHVHVQRVLLEINGRIDGDDGGIWQLGDAGVYPMAITRYVTFSSDAARPSPQRIRRGCEALSTHHWYRTFR